MTAAWTPDELLQPISDEQPTGQNLEDTALLASFDAYRLYGRTKPLEPAPEPDPDAPKTVQDRDEQPPDWSEIKEKSLEALRLSKDLRLLAHCGAALLRTDGLSAFLDTVNVASAWLNGHWDLTYPPVDGDGILRRSALNCFADPIAVIDALRKAPLVNNAVGKYSLRDVDIATGQLAPGKGESGPQESQINGAFAAVPAEELTALQQRVGEAMQSLKAIDAKVREEVGTEAAPTFDLLTAQLAKIDKVLRAQLAARPGAVIDGGETAAGADGQRASASFTGVVRSRQDAVRALDSVATYFRQHEPSSPVPMFCERAKRLISMDFLDVLADIAPDAVPQARAAGGIKE
jgi:type VI secretion system protein ImpA